MVLKKIFSRRRKTKSKMFSLIEQHISYQNYYLMFGNVSNSNKARTNSFLLFWNGLRAN